MTKRPLIGHTLIQLQDLVKELGMPAFTAKQIADWLYNKRVASIDEMTNLSLRNRQLLAEHYEVGRHKPLTAQRSTDGTRKYLFAVPQSAKGATIEAVYIPEHERATLCVSSQSGCKMGCKFCMTARMGFQQHLSASQIINQVLSIPASDTLTNMVYMGMGEPMDNIDEVLRSLEIITSPWGLGWSPTRITVSTIGVLPALKRFLDESRCHLALSLHNPFPNERLEIMPMQKAYDLEEVLHLIRQYDWTGQRRVSLEYILFAGVNDTSRHADELARLLRGMECRVNLIRFHKIPDSPLHGTAEPGMERFKARLLAQGVMTTIRSSRGEDILAACGMLAGKKKE